MNTAKNIQNTLNTLVTKRSQIWQKYDQALQQEAELNNYRKFDNPSVTQTLPPFAKTNSPPDEVASAVWGLKQQVEIIKNAESLIQNCQVQIQQITSQFYKIIAGVLTFLIILVFFLLKR